MATASLADDSEDGPQAIKVACAFRHTNVYADIADLHLHHESVSYVSDVLEPAVAFLSDSQNWLVTEGLAPTFVACTEWGPFTSEEWRDVNQVEAVKYYKDWDWMNDPPSNDDFLDYIKSDWLGTSGQIAPGSDMDAPDVFELMTDAGFLLGCYGGGTQLGSAVDPHAFDMASLWCNAVHSNWLPNGPANTAVYIHYKASAGNFDIEEDFDNIHPDELESPPTCWP